jgi:ABC-type phosphate transport system substrate-binding protein
MSSALRTVRRAAWLVLTSAGLAAAAEPESFKVVVHPSNPASRISRAELAEVFLGSRTRWASGEAIEVLDLSATSPIRAAFSLAVLRLPATEVVRHWQRQVTNRRGTPPKVKASEEDLVAAVAERPRAIGYVSAATPAPGLKLLIVD